MKAIQFLFLFFVSTFVGFKTAQAQNIIAKPNPPKLVTDVAGVLSPEQLVGLEKKLVAIDDSSSNQIAVVIIPTLDGYPIEEYAHKLFRAWGIGSKKTRNGVLLLVAVKDRKVRIEVGYGLEGAIPDITANNIISNVIKPAFKKGDYFQGIDKATDDIAKAAVGEYKVARAKKPKNPKGSMFLFFIILFVIIAIVGGKGGSGGSSIRGGGFSDIATGMLLGSLLGGGRGNGGSDWGGGDSGGFGGFGGGDSGGGGASGDW
jgi:uncharacterized protein